MPTPRPPTDAEPSADGRQTPAHLARLAGLVLDQHLTQRFPWRATEALLAVARSDPGIDPADAGRLVRAALVAVVTSEILASRGAP